MHASQWSGKTWRRSRNSHRIAIKTHLVHNRYCAEMAKANHAYRIRICAECKPTKWRQTHEISELDLTQSDRCYGYTVALQTFSFLCGHQWENDCSVWLKREPIGTCKLFLSKEITAVLFLVSYFCYYFVSCEIPSIQYMRSLKHPRSVLLGEMN